IAVVRSEPRALSKNRFERKGRSQMCIQLGAKIIWSENPTGDQIFAQPWHVVLFKVSENTISVPWALYFPVDGCVTQMRYRRQHVVTGTPRRGQARIGYAGCMEVQREILGQCSAFEDF